MLDTQNHGSEPKEALTHEIAWRSTPGKVKIIAGALTHYQCFSCLPSQLVEHALRNRMVVASTLLIFCEPQWYTMSIVDIGLVV